MMAAMSPALRLVARPKEFSATLLETGTMVGCRLLENA